ncbi:chromate transporter [Cellulosilyticum sp. I15G10I2]|uniref:chromate transporter n=1 Tax=Cellulosilyticum sp. I15G10I2 TaxID=1892843 RepID=UPI00085C5FA0|nr:chromate transporter [Cellulosilyticum sp. I15G10I2]
MKELWILFSAFARVGCFTFGGGYAMLPMLQKEIVDKHGWATESEIMDYYAIGQCTPGVIAINTSTFIGYKHKGIIGAVAATLGMVFPSLIIITLIASILKNFNDLEVVQHAFAGVRVIVSVLVINIVVKMLKTAIIDWIGVVLFIGSLAIGILFNISPAYIIVSAALIGILAQKIREVKKL